MSNPFSIRITTGELIPAVWGVPVGEFNAGYYIGTDIPIRPLTGKEVVVITGKSSGATIAGDDWVADRLGSLGARQVARLLKR